MLYQSLQILATLVQHFNLFSHPINYLSNHYINITHSKSTPTTRWSYGWYPRQSCSIGQKPCCLLCGRVSSAFSPGFCTRSVGSWWRWKGQIVPNTDIKIVTWRVPDEHHVRCKKRKKYKKEKNLRADNRKNNRNAELLAIMLRTGSAMRLPNLPSGRESCIGIILS